MRDELQPFWVALDGVDGCGKSTQHDLLADWYEQLLRGSSRSIHLLRDPGTTTLGMEIRQSLKHGLADRCATAEALLFMAARAQMMHELVHPLYRDPAGQLILSDRHHLSTAAYQGHASRERLPLPDLRLLLQLLGEDPRSNIERQPDLYIVLDVDYETAQRRLASTQPDRLEAVGREEWESRRRGFILEATEVDGLAYGSGVVIDGSHSVEKVHAEITKLCETRWP